MAVVNTKSTQITNADATPNVLNNDFVAKGALFEAVATVEVAAADDDGSVFRMVRVPSNARISEVLRANDAITPLAPATGTVYDIGVYQTADNGGAAVSANLFANDIDLSIASTGFAQTTGVNIADCEKRLWELLGLTADSFRDYDICFTGAAVGNGAGTLSLKVRYTV